MPPPRLAGLTKLTLETAPTVCHACVWWQSRGRRAVDKDRWMEKVELEFGSFGSVYYDGDGRVLGSMQYGPAAAFPRAQELPGGPGGRAVALPRRGRGGAGAGGWGGGGVPLPLPGGRVRVRALPRAKDGL